MEIRAHISYRQKIKTCTFKKQVIKFKKQKRIIIVIKMIPMLLAMKLFQSYTGKMKSKLLGVQMLRNLVPIESTNVPY